MSLRDFWISVRTSARLISPTATVDSPRLNASRIEGILRGAHLWLTPKSVEGFDESDFAFLESGERTRLAKCVSRFREVASQVPTNARATDQQVQQALPEFACILEIMRPDKYGDVEALSIGKTLERRLQGVLPEWVRGLRFETGSDSNGDPALWIWVEVDDDAAKKDVFLRNTSAVRESLEQALRRLGIERWPYIRFRTVSEQAALEKTKK